MFFYFSQSFPGLPKGTIGKDSNTSILFKHPLEVVQKLDKDDVGYDNSFLILRSSQSSMER